MESRLREAQAFLFAVVRDVQRNMDRFRTQDTQVGHGFYSLSCETYSGTSLTLKTGLAGYVSIRCRARRTAEPSD